MMECSLARVFAAWVPPDIANRVLEEDSYPGSRHWLHCAEVIAHFDQNTGSARHGGPSLVKLLVHPGGNTPSRYSSSVDGCDALEELISRAQTLVMRYKRD